MTATRVKILLNRKAVLPPMPALMRESVSSAKKVYVEAAHTPANHKPENEKLTKSCDVMAAASDMNEVFSEVCWQICENERR